MSDSVTTFTAGEVSACDAVQSEAGLVECTENSVEENNPSMVEAALWYVRNGIPVFPCKPRSKEPLTRHGFKDATNDPHTVETLWRRWPQANIAMPTGRISGTSVVDVDPRNGGDCSLENLVARYGSLPDTARQNTGDGGQHSIFRYAGARVPKTLAPG